MGFASAHGNKGQSATHGRAFVASRGASSVELLLRSHVTWRSVPNKNDLGGPGIGMGGVEEEEDGQNPVPSFGPQTTTPSGRREVWALWGSLQ